MVDANLALHKPLINPSAKINGSVLNVLYLIYIVIQFFTKKCQQMTGQHKSWQRDYHYTKYYPILSKKSRRVLERALSFPQNGFWVQSIFNHPHRSGLIAESLYFRLNKWFHEKPG